ncbi:adenine deaminase [Marine Group I thaumarchaeote]|uniref:Adenine deaminase n=1 Tax=Marine Group I thaumarchaeote TaxID=2511932 RepID=A0A7K4MGD8_9ARCH|nr:adenine deaminase [Candidatus Nitrosopumilus sp. MTA1]NWJ27973.1 adenine deaminase [Marine Group I thaumarchaeote]NWJ84568.1 adenine deaminase [Marine Group I thaumarchaeote]NWK07001.1 adenine deaminase [Marine Group I thaumarchaeote]
MGYKKADLVLKNCNLLSVYTKEIIPKTQIAIINDRIAYVGLNAVHTLGSKTVVIDVENKYVSPGFADPHLHIDQFVLPSEFAKKALLCGVTSLFSDPIDIVSVLGYKGFQEFLKLGENLPIRIFQVVPGGLPVDAKFSNSKTLSLSQEKSAVKHPHVLGLGEVFSWTKVTQRDPKTMKSLSTMLECDCIINGHTAGISEKKLNAYVSSGILSCHEPINFDQVLERLRLGMWVMIREGSIRRDLKEIIPHILSHGTYLNRLMFCSDGLDPIDFTKFGHIDHCIRESIKLGLKPLDAITMASKNNFDYYNMGKDLGGIAPGKLADILIFNDLKSFKPTKVFVGGKLVVSHGSVVTQFKKKVISPWMKKTVKLKKFLKNDFLIKSKKKDVIVNTIFMQNEIITKIGSAELHSKDGLVSASLDYDIWKVAAFDRIHGTNRHSIGFLENFGAEIGAFASTWSFHENDMIVIGSNDSDMAIASNHLIKNQGGLVVVKSGKILASLPLQFAGIISTDSFEMVLSNFQKIISSIVDLGCKFTRPHLIPLFLPFLALPSIRIVSGGIVDVKKRSYIRPII